MDQAVLYFANTICCGNKNTTNEGLNNVFLWICCECNFYNDLIN